MAEKIEAWHFLMEDRRLAYKPRRLVKAGQTMILRTGVPSLCEWGYHASIRAIDALKYAPGPVVCRVVLSGDVVIGDDKLCASTRQCVWLADATKTLHQFGVWCAERALSAARVAGREPHLDSWRALQAKINWLAGLITDEQLDAAWSAAWSAARSAAESAAESAVRSAARSAAESAAWSAARSAAWSAAWSAAESAARSAHNEELERRLWLLTPEDTA